MPSVQGDMGSISCYQLRFQVRQLCCNFMHCIIYLIYVRTTIESSYGQQVAQLREQYTQEDKELIKEVLGAKCARSSSHESESPALPQKIMIEDLEQTIIRKFNC